MNLEAELRPGPNRYVSGPDALSYLPTVLADFHHPVVITGTKSAAAFAARFGGPLDLPTFHYDGSASDENGAELAAAIKSADAVVAIGGGRLVDTAKLAAEALNAALISVPTLASNCAPFTPIGAIYTRPAHQFKRVAYFRQAPYLTLVDFGLMLSTPHDYFVAGIGDTLAKWYEIEGITRGRTELPAYTRLAIAAAQTIRELLLANAAPALADHDAGNDSLAFETIVDCIIGLAGEIGGFGGQDGRVAGAHALHNGLSFVPATHPILHGAKVAYGILVQLASTGDGAEIQALIPFYRTIGLPVNRAALNWPNPTSAELAQVTEYAAGETESFRFVDPAITPAKIAAAMRQVEALTAN